MKERQFGWAAEIELPLVSSTGTMQFVGDLEWSRLNEVLNGAYPDERECWTPKYPGHRKSPFYLEGFDEYSRDGARFLGLKVKGVELRTDISADARTCLADAVGLFDVLRETLAPEGLSPSVFGCHPTAPPFRGSRAGRTLADWKAAEVTMSTTGLHVNLSVPKSVDVDFEALRNALNLYAPAMALFSLNSPFLHGDVWRLPDGTVGKSSRTFLRSFYREAVKAKAGLRGTRYHFSLFDMLPSLPHLGALMELSMGVLLSEWNVETTADSVRAYNLAEVGKKGFDAVLFDGNTTRLPVADAAEEVLGKATSALLRHGIRPCFIGKLNEILTSKELFADLSLESFGKTGNLHRIVAESSDFTGRGFVIDSAEQSIGLTAAESLPKVAQL